jgi:hypothetical protein
MVWKGRSVPIVILAAALLLGSAGVARGNPEALVPPDDSDPDLFLIFTGDVIGYVEPCG